MSYRGEEINPLKIFLKFDPPYLCLSYYYSSDPDNPLIHQIKLKNLKSNPTSKQIVDEIYNLHYIYFAHVKKSQVIKFIDLLLDNKNQIKSTYDLQHSRLNDGNKANFIDNNSIRSLDFQFQGKEIEGSPSLIKSEIYLNPLKNS